MADLKVFAIPGMGTPTWINNCSLTFSPEEADIIVFPGGADVHPSLYGQEVGKYTYANLSYDKSQLNFAEKYPDKFKVGQCRGAQLLTVFSGGSLIQDFNGHGGTHPMIIDNNPKHMYYVNSLHHQMMYPFGLPKDEYYVVGRVYPNLGRDFMNGENEYVGMPSDGLGIIEPEIVWYPKTRSLCFQYHPEFMNPVGEFGRTLQVSNDILEKLFYGI